MRKNEQKLWDSMRRNQPKGWWLQRIENVVTDGMPDVHATYRGTEAWIELKAAKSPARESTPLLRGAIRIGQKNWHELCYQSGGASFILTRDTSRNLFLFPGEIVRQLDSLPYRDCLSRYLVSGWERLYEDIRNGASIGGAESIRRSF